MTKSAKDHSKLSLWVFLFGVGLALLGLLAIYDASVVEAFKDFDDKFHFVKQQSTWLGLGVIASLVTASLPVKFLKTYSKHFFFVVLFLMLIVLIPGIGPRLMGARRWIVAGPIVIQPSELIKIAVILYLGVWLQTPRELKQFLVFLGVILGLVMLQPDLGTGLIIVGICFGLYYLSGANLKSIITFVGFLSVAILLLIVVSPYRLNRLKTYMDPSADPLGSSYHITQIFYGLGSGGLSGVGIGQSRQKFAYLPEATTDSIFVIIAEEFGFLGSSVVVFSFLAFIMLAFKVARNSSDPFDKLVAGGISLLFFLQVFVNLSSMTGLVPLTGVPLPFISYGGSSLVSSFIALGLLINIAKRQ